MIMHFLHYILAAAVSSSLTSAQSIVQSSGNYEYLGCFNDVNGNRALGTNTYLSSGTLTVASCAAYCNTVFFAVDAGEYKP